MCEEIDWDRRLATDLHMKHSGTVAVQTQRQVPRFKRKSLAETPRIGIVDNHSLHVPQLVECFQNGEVQTGHCWTEICHNRQSAVRQMADSQTWNWLGGRKFGLEPGRVYWDSGVGSEEVGSSEGEFVVSGDSEINLAVVEDGETEGVSRRGDDVVCKDG